MKSVIKKAFSLLLVSVVAVSMFSFITPNRVDARKVELSKDYVYVFSKGTAKVIELGHYTIKFFDINGNQLAANNSSIKRGKYELEKREKIYLPFWTAKIEVEVVTPKIKGGKQTKTTFTAIPDMPRSNVRPERKILAIGVIENRIGVRACNNNIESPREVCAIFDCISETL